MYTGDGPAYTWRVTVMVFKSQVAPTQLGFALSLILVGCGGGEETATASDTFNPTSTTGTTAPTTTTDGETTETTEDGSGGSMSSSSDSSSSTNPTTEGPTTSDSETDPTTMDPTDPTDATTDPTDTDPSTTSQDCIDGDQDGYGANCDNGPDCDDNNPYVWSDDACATCMDADMDGAWVGCDTYPDDKPEPDCDDNDPNNFTPDGCANCADVDMDDYWVNCDAYDDNKQGPDCDDNNAGVGADDEVELCDGIAQNCAGEIDPLPADEMCPPPNAEPPYGENVNPIDGWICDVEQVGQDGCKVNTCLEQYFDIDEDPGNGCECEGTSRNFSLAECSDDIPGYLGVVGEGQEISGEDLVLGVIPEIDNGKGAGREDWYWVEFPEMNGGVRPTNGQIQVDFQLNEGPGMGDYRFEVYRDCDGTAWAQDLAANQTNPPALEWWFFDIFNTQDINPGPPPQFDSVFTKQVNWPNKVYIRVFRVNSPNTCSAYRLGVRRVDN